MEVIIRRSKKAGKKFDAVIDGKNLLVLVLQVTATIPNTKIQRESDDTSIYTKKLRIGVTRRQQDFTPIMFYGINLH